MQDAESDIDRVIRVISAYVGNNQINPDRLPALIEQLYTTIARLQNYDDKLQWVEQAVLASGIGGSKEPVAAAPMAKPAVAVEASIHDDHLVCLEDGLPFKSLKRHLMASHGLAPEQYREKWRLPADYPMVCKAYANARSDVALRTGLGRIDKATKPKSA